MSNKPVIFISSAHADEPDKPAEDEVQWLTFVRRYLQPAVKNGLFTRCAIVLHAAAKYDEAARLFAEAERRHKEREPNNPLLYGIQGCQYCDLLITRGSRIATG
jgi:hypothetical protein